MKSQFFLNLFFNPPIYVQIDGNDIYAKRNGWPDLTWTNNFQSDLFQSLESGDSNLFKILSSSFVSGDFTDTFFVIKINTHHDVSLSNLLKSLKAINAKGIIIKRDQDLSNKEIRYPNQIKDNVLYRDRYYPGWVGILFLSLFLFIFVSLANAGFTDQLYYFFIVLSIAGWIHKIWFR